MKLDFRVILKPDVEPPKTTIGSPLSKGWVYIPDANLDCVVKACSGCLSHGYGWEGTDRRGAMELYSTKELAMNAYRAALADAFERKLAEIDELIKQESK